MNVKKIAYFLVFGSMVVGGMAGVLYFGLQPKSVPKITLSQFDHPGQAGVAVARRLMLELKDAPVLLLGVWPGRDEDMQAAKALLDTLPETGAAYDVVIVEPLLPGVEIFPNAEKISVRDEAGRFAEGVKNAIGQGRRVVAIVPSMFASQLLRGGPATRLRDEFGLAVTSVSFAPFPRTRDDEGSTDVQCSTSDDPNGVGALGCAVINKARTMYRKKKDPARYQGALDLVGGRDYLMLLAPPIGS